MADDDIGRIRALLARYSAGDAAAVRELIAPAFFTYVPGADEPTASDVYAGFAADFKAAAPDLAIEVPDLAWGEDGLLRGTAVVTATATGSLWDVPPTGHRHRFEIPVTLRAVDGRYAVNVELGPPAAIAILRELEVVNPADEMHLPPRHPVVFPDFLIKVVFDGQVGERPCRHLDEVHVTRPAADRCDDCGPDEIWPALRMCLTCGHVGCCDTSTNKHAKAHWEQTGHPMMRSIRMDEGWLWCYEDGAAFSERTLARIEARLAGTA